MDSAVHKSEMISSARRPKESIVFFVVQVPPSSPDGQANKRSPPVAIFARWMRWAGAIASIAFGERAPLVDGNVIRVLSRLKAVASDPKNAGLNKLCW